MTTIKDVARLAKVSPSTVSRVVNNTGRISQDTRDRVREAMAESGYRMNRAARALVTNKSGVIGFVTNPDEGPFYASLLQHLSRSILINKNARLMIDYGQNNVEGELLATERLLEEMCDIVIMYSRHISETEAQRLVKSTDVPIVFLNRNFASLPDHCVGIDNFSASYKAVCHLIKQGHRDIACIYGSKPFVSGAARYRGYVQALSDHGLTANPNLVYSQVYHPSHGWDAIHKFQHQNFTAIFSTSSAFSVGAVKALHTLGYRIPEDVSIIGFDNDVLNDFFQPALTTVEIPINELAAKAIERGIDLLEGKETLQKILIHGELVLRNSVLNRNASN